MRYVIILISLALFGCGTRKTELEASRSSVSASSVKSIDIELKKDVNASSSLSTLEHLKESEKDIELIEEFHDNGQLKKRTYRETSKLKDKSSHKDSLSSQIDKSKLSKRTAEKSSFNTFDKKKSKKTTADKTVAVNTGGAGWLYAMVISVVIIILFFIWLRKPVKKEEKK